MALTITKIFATPIPIADRYMNVVTVAFDNSYTTGGLSLLPTDIGFASTTDPEWHIHVAPQAGYVFAYDYTGQKLIAYAQDGVDDNPLAEQDNGTDLSAVTGVRVTAYGRYRN